MRTKSYDLKSFLAGDLVPARQLTFYDYLQATLNAYVGYLVVKEIFHMH